MSTKKSTKNKSWGQVENTEKVNISGVEGTGCAPFLGALPVPYISLNGELGLDHLRQIDTYEIPLDVLREALVITVVHRDYLMSGSDIKIAVYDSKIEITSPREYLVSGVNYLII